MGTRYKFMRIGTYLFMRHYEYFQSCCYFLPHMMGAYKMVSIINANLRKKYYSPNMSNKTDMFCFFPETNKLASKHS
jgi:hypothetical protein